MKVALALALLLTACGGGGGHSDRDAIPRASASMMDAQAVEIGPIIEGRNYSLGLPLHPTPRPEGGWSFDLGPDKEPHYISARLGSLAGKSQIRLRYAVELAAGASIIGAGCSTPGTITVFFQRSGDDWSADGGRFWATFATRTLEEGEFEIVAPLGANWTSVQTMSAVNNPTVFAGAKDRADRVGFTLGNCEGFGHGVRATGPGTFRLIAFEVQ